MINTTEIYNALRDKYNSGATQEQIANEAQMSQTYIGDLLSWKRKIDGLTLKKINQLFPTATLSLGNRTIGNNNTIGARARVQSDNNFLSPGKDVEDYQRTLIDAVIDLDIDDIARTKVLKLIKKINEK